MAVATRDLTGAALVTIDTPEFRQALSLAHNAVQWLGRVAASYGAAVHGKRGVQLTCRGMGVALHTARFANGVSLEARLPEFALQFCVDGRPVPHLIDLDDRTPAAVEAWILVELLHYGLDRDQFSKALPYRIAGLMEGDGRAYDANGCRAGLANLASWLSFATSTLDALAPASARPVMLDPETFEGRIDFADGPVSLAAPSQNDHGVFSLVGTRGTPAGFAAIINGRPEALLTTTRIVDDAMTIERAVAVLNSRFGSHDA